jgi:hypothetical protein
MSELKFTCPLCGQYLQCEKAYGGDKISCPTCQAELRVPFSHTPPEPKTQLPHAELITSPPATAAPPTGDTTLTDVAVPVKPASKPAAPAPEREPHYLCPCCHAELRLPRNGVHSGQAPIPAELVQPAGDHSSTQPCPGEHTSVVEREQQIAHAREANPVSLYPAMKPRLDYVLNGGKAVAPDGHGAADPSHSPGPNNGDGAGGKSLTE